MKRKKRVSKKLAALLTMVLVFSVLVVPKAEAANAVQTDAKCSVEFAVNTTGFKELNNIAIPVHLYKIASINESGSFTAEEAFSSLDVSSVDHESDAPAKVWEERAKEAAKLVTDKMEPAATVTVEAGKATVSDLSTGLYLVIADTTNSDNFEYSFQPYLISLPNNYYYSTGVDAWVYDLAGSNAIGLKPQEDPRYGDLKITKTLVNQNVTSGDKATFVFQIDIVSLEGKAESKLASFTFDGVGSQEAVVEHIPSGSTVTVTEIYSGASYTATQSTATTTIAADTVTGVEFENKHNDIPNGGYGINNHFEKDEAGQYQYIDSEIAQQ